MIAYKFLHADGSGVFTGFRWPLPDGAPGAWVDAAVDPCRSGIHACRRGDLPHWVGMALYEIELDGAIVESPTKVIATRGRLLRRIDAWTTRCATSTRDAARTAGTSWRAARRWTTGTR